MRRGVILLALLMVVVLVASAPMAEAKQKKRKHRHHAPPPPSLPYIQCPTQGDGSTCLGTPGADFLVDEANAFTAIFGRPGSDTYIEQSGDFTSADTLQDTNDASNDYYYLVNKNFNKVPGDALWVLDSGGTADTLDLSATGYRQADCPTSKIDADRDGNQNDLLLDCPGNDDIIVFDYYTTDSIDSFKFADGSVILPKSIAASEGAQAQQQTPRPLITGKHPSGLVDQAKADESS